MLKASKKRETVEKVDVPPFLKWAGGKRWFVQTYAQLLPKKFNRYIEPFLGGASVFFHLQPKAAILGDINPDLIAAYIAVKDRPESVIESLRYRQDAHDDNPDGYYYRVRDRAPADSFQRGSRMIYLNRTCFNGIYRVNQAGLFNVPRGSKEEVILSSDDFRGISKLLKGASIRVSDFEPLIDAAQSGDLIFADPPYTVRHNLNGFIKYNEKLFSWDDQERLAKALIRAKRRGAKIVCTNADHVSVRELYDGSGFHLQTVSRYSSISAASDSRKQFEELVILSHPNAGE